MNINHQNKLLEVDISAAHSVLLQFGMENKKMPKMLCHRKAAATANSMLLNIVLSGSFNVYSILKSEKAADWSRSENGGTRVRQDNFLFSSD